jgi:glycosyltransferase involved in cell wall biosynthesis
MTDHLDHKLDKNEKVSVILLTVNRFEYLDESTSSLLAQTYADWELIIIQDGNNIDVTSKIKSLLERDKRIFFYQRPNLNSIGSSINYAIKKATGKYIAILDDDDIWIDRKKLQEQVSLFQTNNKLSLAASWAIGIDKNGMQISEIKKSNDIEFIKKTCLIFNPIIHSSALYSKELAYKVGLYNENIPDYQDWDFVLKVLQEGEINIIPKFMIGYRMWDGNSTSNKVASMIKSTYMIIKSHRKYFPNAYLAFIYYFFFLIYSKAPVRVQKITTKYISVLKKNLYNKYS